MDSNDAKRVHRMHLEFSLERGPRAWCTTCGIEDHPNVILQHIRESRRWDYLGIEVHEGEEYHMWEHRLTKVRFAWLKPMYALRNTTPQK